MDRFENKNTEKTEYEQESYILEYPAVVDTVKVSLARQLKIPGALEAHTFEEILLPFSPSQRQYIENSVGVRFDDEIIYYITCLMILDEGRNITIIAEDSEGFDGHLPWQHRLEEAIRSHDVAGDLPGAHIAIERYQKATDIHTFAALGEVALTDLAA